MQTRPLNFTCSDGTLTEEWEARVSTHEITALSKRILQRLDSEPVVPGEDGIAAIIAPLQTILGIAADEPGFTCVRVAPHPGELIWAKGWITLPEGLVMVAWERLDDRFILDITIPVGVHLKAILPAHPQDALFVNDEPVDPDSQTIRTAHHVELAVLPGSEYRFEVVSV